MDNIDLKMKICESSLDDEIKNSFLESVDAYYESGKVNKAVNKADDKLWKKSLSDAGSAFKQQVATIKQLQSGTNQKALQRKIREARKSLSAMDDAISGVSGQAVFQSVKQIMIQAKFDSDITKKADLEMKNGKKLQSTGDPYNIAASKLINIAGDWLNLIDNKIEG